MKKIFTLAVLLIIIALGIWFLQSQSPVEQIEQNKQQNQEEDIQENKSLVSTSTILQLDSFYNIKANYPQFVAVDQNFNQKIADLISGKVEIFKKDAKDYQQARKETALPGETVSDIPEQPFDFISNWTPVQIGDKYISFVIDIYYFSGGAHGMNEVFALNYDIEQKKEITIEEFLNFSENDLQKISKLAVDGITLQLEEKAGGVDESMKTWIEDGAGSEWENFKDFNFGENTMIIYFQRYQVAAGSFGPITIIIPKLELENNFINSSYLK
jgi:hypothetical protein